MLFKNIFKETMETVTMECDYHYDLILMYAFVSFQMIFSSLKPEVKT